MMKNCNKGGGYSLFYEINTLLLQFVDTEADTSRSSTVSCDGNGIDSIEESSS